MQTLSSIKHINYIFNHLIYDTEGDRLFSKHSHSLYEMIYVISGKATYSIENQIYHAKPNDLILIKPYTYHFFEITENAPYEKISILFDANYLKLDLSFVKRNATVTNNKDNIIQNTFDKLVYYHDTFNEDIFSQLMLACTREIVYNLSLSTSDAIDLKQHSNLIKVAIDYISDNLFTIKTMDEISNALFVSKNYFLSLFSHEMNISPKKYIIEKRLLYAHDMIQMGKKPSNIYESLGFVSYTAFYRAFMSYFGYSPSSTKMLNKTKGKSSKSKKSK